MLQKKDTQPSPEFPSTRTTSGTAISRTKGSLQRRAIKSRARKRILIEASKLDEPRMDGIKRYVQELVQGLHAASDQDNFAVDILVNGRVYDLENLPEKFLKPAAADGSTRTTGPGIRHRLLHGVGILLPPITLPLIKQLMPDAVSRALLGKAKADLKVPEPGDPGPSAWALWVPPAARAATHRLRPQRLLRSLRALVKTRAQTSIPTDGYDLVHLTLPNNFHYLTLRPEQPLLVTVHDLSHHVCPEHQNEPNNVTLDRGLEGSMAAGARFLTVSDATRLDLLQTYGLELDRAATVHNGCSERLFHAVTDEADHQRVRKKYDIPRGDFFLCLCTIEPRKNLARTIRAFEMLIEMLEDSDVHLVLAGSQGWKVKETMNTAKRNSGRVHFAGFVADSDLATFYSAASAFVFASHYEGFGFPLLEAMRCGIPVIYGDNSSMREIVGDAGLPVDSEDTAELAAQMQKLLQNPDLAANLGRRGQERAANFSWQNSVSGTAFLYRQLLGQGEEKGAADIDEIPIFGLPQRRRVVLDYQPEPGCISGKAERLVQHCLGDFASQPVLPCTKDRSYLEHPGILLLEADSGQVILTAGNKRASKKSLDPWDQKRVVRALASQRAAIPPALTCWLASGDNAGRTTDPEQGLHISGVRDPTCRDLVLVPTACRSRFLGPNLERQLDELRSSWVPWEEKTDTVWWGGSLTGDGWRKRKPNPLTRREVLCHFRDNPSDQVSLNLVRSPGRREAPPGIEMTGRFEKKTAFGHKCIVLLPGNDIASGSSWYFAGNSVVLMPKPHLEHILYFELNPWEHYVPLENDPADILTKLHWVLNNQDEARGIVANSHERLRWLCGPEYRWACNEVLRTISN